MISLQLTKLQSEMTGRIDLLILAKRFQKVVCQNMSYLHRMSAAILSYARL